MQASSGRAGSGSPCLRASDADREQAIDALRERFADGCLTQDSFVRRIEVALRAREHADLAALLADLPAPMTAWGQLLGMMTRARQAASAQAAAWLRQPPAALMLPSGARDNFIIGREADCDLVLGHRSVSRRHAGLHRSADGWLLGDLDSTNGTRLNGWRVTYPVSVRPGDHVAFGAVSFVICERP